MNSITLSRYDEFLSSFGYSKTDDGDRVVALSFVFLSTLPFCKGVADDAENAEVIANAQCFIAYAMSSDGGGFDPAAVAETRILTRESLGRNALTDEYKANDALIGTDPESLLKRIPLAYGLLKPLLCNGESSLTSGAIDNIELMR